MSTASRGLGVVVKVLILYTVVIVKKGEYCVTVGSVIRSYILLVPVPLESRPT